MKRGAISILGIIILAVLVVFLLNYLNIHIKVEVGDGGGSSLWNDYLKEPVEKIWQFILENFWEPFVANMQSAMHGGTFDFGPPTVPPQ